MIKQKHCRASHLHLFLFGHEIGFKTPNKALSFEERPSPASPSPHLKRALLHRLNTAETGCRRWEQIVPQHKSKTAHPPSAKKSKKALDQEAFLLPPPTRHPPTTHHDAFRAPPSDFLLSLFREEPSGIPYHTQTHKQQKLLL